MKNMKFTPMGKKTAHLLSRNILSTAAVIALMGAATFAAAPAGGYLPGATLDPDCAPSDADCIVQGGDMSDDSWTMSGANVIIDNGNVGIGTDEPIDGLHVASGSIIVASDNTITGNFWDGSSSEDGIKIHPSGAIMAQRSTYAGLYLGRNSSLGTGSGIFLEQRIDGTGIGGIVSDGVSNVFMGTSSAGISSDGDFESELFVANDGNVGIGTNSPSNAQGWNRVFDVNGQGHAKILATEDQTGVKTGIFSNTNWGGNTGSIGTESSHDLRIITGYSEKMRVTTDGNIGIGTATPEQKLHVMGQIRLDQSDVSEYTRIGIGPEANDMIFSDNSAAGSYGSGIFIRVHDEAAPYKYRDAMVFTEKANVGIGTTSPTDKLSIVGPAYNAFGVYRDYDASVSPAGVSLKIGSKVGTDLVSGAQIISGVDGTGTANEGLPFGIDILNGGTMSRKVSILPNGNVGIGTTAPDAKLDVAGPIIQGDGGLGTLSQGIATHFTNVSNTTNYFHIKVPYDITVDNKMFHISVKGYSLYGPSVIDLTYSGYVHKNGGALQYKASVSNGSTNVTDVHQYIGSDDKLYLRFKVPNTYYTTFRIDAIRVGNGTLLKEGDLTVIEDAALEL